MPTSIALTIDGDVIELHSMGQAVVDFSGLLAGLDEALSRDGREAVRWEIEAVSYSSPFRIVASAPVEQGAHDRAAEVAAACLRGVGALAEGAVRPEAFNDEALQRVENLGALTGNGITAIHITDPSAEPRGESDGPGLVVVTPATARNAAAVLASGDTEEREVVHGSVEGHAEAFNRPS